jgi:DNA-binding NtrC family response regulator
LNRPLLEVAPEALHCLLGYSWPGNVRELRNAMERAAALCTGFVVEVSHLPQECTAPPPEVSTLARPPDVPPPPSDMRGEVRRAARSLERERIVDALGRCSGNQSAAAKLLGISRRTLVARLSEYKIPRPIKDNES